ncbi:MAG: isoaspartyl peptidase/L-asparaginase family protein [Acidiferrobacteraceae bacterium]
MFAMVHGGAGRYLPEETPRVLEGCRAGTDAAWRLLSSGASALDVVEAAVRVLEDNPLFNAGTGSVLNADGIIEMDASIMEGRTLRAGAVANVRRVRNPVSVARKVLEDGRHVLLAGDGATRFARASGIPDYPEERLVTERQRRRWRTHGTVGAVALDASGVLAAATSTGGLFGKRPGRIADSALIGSGTYADDKAAVSCTGLGEAIIRTVMAHRTAFHVRRNGDAQRAAEEAVAYLAERTAAEAGVIVIGADGCFGYAHATPDMPVGWCSEAGATTAMRR